MTQPKGKINWSLWLRLAGTLVALGLLVYLLLEQGWQEILAALQRLPLWVFLAGLGLMMVSRFAVIYRWHVLLRSAGMPIPFAETTRITFAGLFATNFLPTTIGGDVVRLAGAVRLQYDPAVSAASLIADRLVGMFGMALVVPLSFPSLFSADRIHAFLPAVRGAGFLLAAGPLPLPAWLRKMWNWGWGLARRMVAALGVWLRQPRALLLSLAASGVHMLCMFAILTLLFWGMGEQINFWLVAGLYSLVYFVIMLPFSINGYGLQELSMTYIFSTLGGVSVQSSLAVALLFRTLMMLASLPGAAFVPGLLADSRNSG
jgi:uncharacterized membrane protein YbhN (UPF0104 family)